MIFNFFFRFFNFKK